MAVDLTEKYTSTTWADSSGNFMSPNYVFLLNEMDNYDEFVLQGSARCFSPDTLVSTNKGLVPIREIDDTYKVQSYNGNDIVYNKVLHNNRFSNEKGTIRIKLKNGKEIVCSDDHKFYHKGEWIPIIDILNKLKHETDSKL